MEYRLLSIDRVGLISPKTQDIYCSACYAALAEVFNAFQIKLYNRLEDK